MAIGVQEADVWAAADAVLQAGEQPTIERVRLQMGRGSPNTVGPHLKAWFRALGRRLNGTEQTTVGPVPDSVNQAARHFWEFALDAAKDEWQQAVAIERQALTQAQEQLAADQQLLRTEQQRLDQRETDLKAAIYSAREQAATALARAQTLEDQLKQSETRAAALELRLAQAAEREHDLQERQHEAESRHRQVLTNAEQRHASHERRWLNDLDTQRQATKKAQDDLEQERKARDQERKAVAARQNEDRTALAQMTEDLRARTNEVNHANHELVNARRVVAELEQARSALQTQLAMTQSSADSAQQNLEERIADLHQRVAEQGTQLHIKDQQIAAQTLALTQARAPSQISDDPSHRR